jgi:hypothetical protein
LLSKNKPSASCRHLLYRILLCSAIAKQEMSMISKLDDYPIHQNCEPVAYTATRDRYTYDRFWYNGHARVGSFYFAVWVPIHWENRCTLAGLFEDASGSQWHTDQAIVPVYEPSFESGTNFPPINDANAQLWDGRVGHQLTFEPGTRRATAAVIRMNDKSGESLEIELEPVLLFRLKGIGYMHPQWGHGQWKGELAIAAESWKCDEVDPLALENIHIQQVVKARCGDDVGYGVLEQMHLGPFEPYGLKDWFDGAPAPRPPSSEMSDHR